MAKNRITRLSPRRAVFHRAPPSSGPERVPQALRVRRDRSPLARDEVVRGAFAASGTTRGSIPSDELSGAAEQSTTALTKGTAGYTRVGVDQKSRSSWAAFSVSPLRHRPCGLVPMRHQSIRHIAGRNREQEHRQLQELKVLEHPLTRRRVGTTLRKLRLGRAAVHLVAYRSPWGTAPAV
jgi:hypothetical protein